MPELRPNSSVHLVWKTPEPICLEIPEGAKVTSLRVLEGEPPSSAPIEHRISVAAGATFEHLDLVLGGASSRWEVVLQGERARAHLYGIHGAGRGISSQSDLTLRHVAPRCKSFQYYKCIAAEGGKSVFRSRVVVEERAVESDAHQTNRNMILGHGAHAVSEPELEIYTDAVKCSHGSTTGQLDGQALFYLRSRGLSEAEAKNLLVEAFAKDLLESLPDFDRPDALGWARQRWESWVRRGLM